MSAAGIPPRAAAVVIGSGAFGSATAYHLARRGRDVVLLDQHALGSQTSPRAAGLTSQADPVPVLARLRREACDAFARFEADMGRSIDYHRSGSLRAAYTEAGERRLRESLATAEKLGIPARIVSPAEAERLAPHFRTGRPRAILHVPDDGWLDPARLAVAAAARAAELGARTLPFTRVTGLLAEGGRVAGVVTDRGEIRTPAVVDAAGAWTARVAAGAGVRVPLVPVRHQLLVTEPIAGMEPLQPIVRMVEASVYVRHEQGGLLFGGYEDAPRVVDPATLAPDFQIADLPLDLSQVRALIDDVGEHFPALRTPRVAVHRGGLPTMTADGRPLLGRVPGLEGLFVASGCCVGGLGLSPAAGRALADLSVDGTSDPDLSPLSVERFRGRLEEATALQAACVTQYARRYLR